MVDIKTIGPREWAGMLVLLVLALVVPVVGVWQDQSYYLALVTRIMVLALAATGLNFALGYGGMVSLGHAMYLGVGSYAVGVLSEHGVDQAWLHIAVALGVGGVLAWLVGSVCLRTTGMAFIMITLAFAQMAYFVAVGLKRYGGEDGLQVAARSKIAGLDMGNVVTFYLVVLACLLVALWVVSRMVRSRFGMVLRGSMLNGRRMVAMGFPSFRYRLLGYVLSAELCVLAGVLMANLTRFVSPSYMQWSMSGELIVMVVLGGIGTLLGPLVGAATLILLEEALSNVHIGDFEALEKLVNTHWLALIGLFIVLVTLNMKRGLLGSLRSGKEPS